MRDRGYNLTYAILTSPCYAASSPTHDCVVIHVSQMYYVAMRHSKVVVDLTENKQDIYNYLSNHAIPSDSGWQPILVARDPC